MRGPGPDDVLYAFGPFIADSAMGVLRRDGQTVPLTLKSFEVLMALIERCGELVEKDLLLKLVWPDTVVEENNLARHISTLRKVLDDHTGEHQYIVTVQGRGYRFVAPVQEITRATADAISTTSDRGASRLPGPGSPTTAAGEPSPIEAPREAAAQPVNRSTRTGILALAALAAVAAVVTSIVMFAGFGSSPSESPERKLWQLTSSGGLEGEATWAPDGQAMVYSSDRGGNLDLWKQPVGEGNPVQLTFSRAEDWQPSWSPDGRSIAFRSERDGGGLFIVPAGGGPEQRLTNFGYKPEWSPKGSQLLFYSTNNIGRSKLYLVGADGQQLRRVLSDALADFTSFRVAWHPDGRRLSVYGTHRTEGLSFWTVPLDHGEPVKSGLSAEVEKRLKKTAVSLTQFRWAPAGDALYFEGRSDEAVNIWRVKVDPRTLQWRDGPERLTVGAGLDTNIAVAPDGGKLAFTIRSERTRLWSFPFDPNEGRLLGKGEPITAPGADALYPDVSPNGNKVVYRTTRRGKQELWARSLLGGEERMLTSASEIAVPKWSSDGSMLAFRRQRPIDASGTRKEVEIVLLSADGQHERLLTTPGLKVLTPYGWSPDDNWIVAACEHGPSRLVSVCLLRVSEAPHAQDQMRVIASDPDRNLYQATFSPNQRWIAFNAVPSDVGSSTIYVVAVDGGQWVPITEGAFWDDKPRWSPDGKTLYFVSNRSGFLNAWGRHFDPATGKPSGDPFRITTFENASERVYSPINTMEMAIAPHQLILPIVEASAAVWVLENIDR
jgi:Tol biopolymer transport system component/DNA-binding winged helix-turn-helix (wHTH) protein